MIKISFRDVLADLPPSVLKKKIKEMDDNVVNIQGYHNYTPDKMEKLEKLFDEGKIKSHPVNLTDYDPYGDYSESSNPDAPGFVWVDREDDKHRDNDLPAEEWSDGTKTWYLNGLEHRENNKPSVIYANGDKRYCYHGGLHREDGPAIKRGDEEYYYLGNDEYGKTEYDSLSPEKKRALRPK